MSEIFSQPFFAVAFVLIIVMVLIFKRKNTSSEYDERQIQIRGRAYKYGFFTLIISILVSMALSVGTTINIISTPLMMFICLCIGIAVFAVYSISHDAFIEINGNFVKKLVLFVIIGAVNVFTGVKILLEGKAIDNGVLSFDLVNLIVGILYIFIFIVLLVKWLHIKINSELD